VVINQRSIFCKFRFKCLWLIHFVLFGWLGFELQGSVAQMSWNLQMDSHYGGSSTPYNSTGSFMDFFAGLTYDHVNFIFAGSSSMQVQTRPLAFAFLLNTFK